MTIQVKGLRKKYFNKEAVKGVDFTIEPESIIGLLGRNGAGKSTVLNMIARRIEKTSGDITLDGVDLHKTPRAMHQVYLSSTENWFPKEYKFKDLLSIYKKTYPEFDSEFAEDLIKVFGVNVKERFSKASTGYQSIMKIILALCNPSEYIFMDEPVLGLDANHRHIFNKKLLEAYARNPRTFIIATHLIEEVASILEKVIVIKDGVVTEEVMVEEVLGKGYVVSGATSLVQEFVADKNVQETEQIGNITRAVVIGKKGETPQGLDFSALTLQDYFISITRKENE